MRKLLVLGVLVWATTACLLENGMSSVYLSAFEDLKLGGVIGKLPILETDGDDKKADVELVVVKGADLIDIVPSTKELILKKALDRDEGMGKFEAVVECRSSNADADFSQLNISVFVTVKDVNDNAPVFDSPEYSVSIKEELPIGTIVFMDFEATDNDQPGPNSFVQYSIVKGPHSDLLDIPDPFKPVIVVKHRIDYEHIKEFSVEIEARDQGEPSLSTRVPLHVTVVDTNDLPPRFRHSYYTARSIRDGLLVMEPEAISAQDGDRLNAPLIFSLSGEFSEHFAVDEHGSVMAKSKSPPPRATFFVTRETYSAQISATTPVGSTLLTVKAFSESNATIAYSILGDTNAVSIDEASGRLTLKQKLEKTETVNVTASDGEHVITTTLDLVAFNHDEKCPKAPKFDRYEYKMTIGSLNVLGTVNATSKDGNRIVYTILNMNSDFTVDSNGVVKIIPGSHPQCKICELIVTARDGQQLSVAKVIVENTALVIPTTATLTVLILIILVLIFTLLMIIVCRRFHKIRYVVNSDKERCYDAKSPGPKRSQGAHLVPVTVTSHDGATPTVYF